MRPVKLVLVPVGLIIVGASAVLLWVAFSAKEGGLPGGDLITMVCAVLSGAGSTAMLLQRRRADLRPRLTTAVVLGASIAVGTAAIAQMPVRVTTFRHKTDVDPGLEYGRYGGRVECEMTRGGTARLVHHDPEALSEGEIRRFLARNPGVWMVDELWFTFVYVVTVFGFTTNTGPPEPEWRCEHLLHLPEGAEPRGFRYYWYLLGRFGLTVLGLAWMLAWVASRGFPAAVQLMREV